ncbi:response regulator transcription factor [Maribacter sp. HTCC2170]|uniref:response regulator transcription factor n=1 Tax=Maribacter sp. (strain HTCC2170 / KCCM 42371) TaxID=313603 RepID=UPI00006B487D|nr:response regulator transcription factor [Maribacter sp. HTCC2170]EAR01852.1 DNA-binding response regulator, LuxR family protein [Maribacter sp. HTCC2170]
MKTDILKIIIVDHNFVLHKDYRAYFKEFPDFDLKGIYGTTEEALNEYDAIQPDIILSEVGASDIRGIHSIRLFRKKDRHVKVLMISDKSDFEIIKNAFKNGANGYLTKPLDNKRIHSALNSIKYEGAAMSQDIVQKIISNFHVKSYTSFSERENQIVDYLCKGATYKVMAEKLFVTTSTINFHIQNIYLKLNVNSKSEALVKLQEMEL